MRIFSETLEDFSETYDLYILFIDLCDSTELKQSCLDKSLPDILWISRQKLFLSRVSNIIENYKGNIVKTIGDEVMGTFPVHIQPFSIIKCVIEIFQTFENLQSFNKGEFKIFSKASIDFGICYDGQVLDHKTIDPIGRCVDRCARLSKFADKNEIVISNEFKDTLNLENGLIKQVDFIEQEEKLKGIGNTKFFKIKF